MGILRCIVYLPARAGIRQIGGGLLPEMAEQETCRYERKLSMVHRHPILYRILCLIFLCSTLVLMVLSAAPAWPSATRAALLLLSVFPLILSLSYFHLGNQEERGY
jgi:hypothetical protein